MQLPRKLSSATQGYLMLWIVLQIVGFMLLAGQTSINQLIGPNASILIAHGIYSWTFGMGMIMSGDLVLLYAILDYVFPSPVSEKLPKIRKSRNLKVLFMQIIKIGLIMMGIVNAVLFLKGSSTTTTVPLAGVGFISGAFLEQIIHGFSSIMSAAMNTWRFIKH